MVHLDNLKEGERVVIGGRAYVKDTQEALRRKRRMLLREKCLHALKRKHWMSVADEIQYGGRGYGCFSEYPLHDPSLLCHSYLKAGEVGCEACVIVTKLLEVLDE